VVATLSAAYRKDRPGCYRECQNAYGYQGEDSQNSSKRPASKVIIDFSILSLKHFFATPYFQGNGSSWSGEKGTQFPRAAKF